MFASTSPCLAEIQRFLLAVRTYRRGYQHLADKTGGDRQHHDRTAIEFPIFGLSSVKQDNEGLWG